VPAFAIDATFAGSASIDYRWVSGDVPPTNPSPLGINGLTLEVAQKVVAEVGHGISFSVKACAGCHGLEVDQAFAEAHVTSWFNVRAGRLNVPFGEFNVRHDPTNFSTPSKPLPYAMGDMLLYTRSGFNLGIVPAPYVDNGLEVFGSLTLGAVNQLDYALYVVKGLAGNNDFDFQLSRTFLDHNKTPAFGGRLVLTGPDWSVGASGSAGLYDPRDTLWYVMGGLEFYLRADPVTIRAEALFRRTELDPGASYAYQVVDPWFLKLGWYTQVDVQVARPVTLVLRSDGLWRAGLPLPEAVAQEPSAMVLRQTAAVLWRVEEHFAIKADYELWTFTGVAEPMRHLVRVGVVGGY
jgi:hypothetical protein